MTTIFKLRLSLIGNKVKNAFTETAPIDIVNVKSPKNSPGLRKPVISLPSETSPYSSNDSGILSIIKSTRKDDEDLPRYSLLEVLSHDTADDCWLIVYDLVYDLTNFLWEHPGGEEILLEYAGRDATLAFRSVGHSRFAENSLEPYLIGILEDRDRLGIKRDIGMRRGTL